MAKKGRGKTVATGVVSAAVGAGLGAVAVALSDRNTRKKVVKAATAMRQEASTKLSKLKEKAASMTAKTTKTIKKSKGKGKTSLAKKNGVTKSSHARKRA